MIILNVWKFLFVLYIYISCYFPYVIWYITMYK